MFISLNLKLNIFFSNNKKIKLQMKLNKNFIYMRNDDSQTTFYILYILVLISMNNKSHLNFFFFATNKKRIGIIVILFFCISIATYFYFPHSQ
jgi:hypothetical protein